MTRVVFSLAAGLVLAVAIASPAWAHKVILSCYPAGDVIEGELGFSSGDMAADTVVEVFDPDGNKLGETTTNADGYFVYTPTQAVPHVFRANLGAGHVGEYVMPVADLPAGLASGDAPTPTPTEAVASGADAAEGPGMAITPEVTDMIAEAVRNEMRPLRREIAAYKEHHDVQTILGGVGYIFGLFGLAFFLMARRQGRSGT